MSIRDGRQCQQIVRNAMQQYTDRHNFNFNETGAKDLNTLQNCNPSTLYTIFGSSPQTGLTEAQVRINAEKYGRNQYKKRKTHTLCQIFKEAISDEMLIILLISAVVSVIVQYFSGTDPDLFWVDGASILLAVIVCSMVATISNYDKQKQFIELDKMTEDSFNIDVIRNGVRKQIHRTQIVPGDMIYVTNGMQIPADCLLYKGVEVLTNESAITGESHELQKNIFERCIEQRMDPKGPTPFMISGSNIVGGEGLMMAVVVGKESRAGRNFQLLFSKQDDQNDQTPLQQQLQDLASQIGKFGLVSAIIIFVLLLGRFLVQSIIQHNLSFHVVLQKIVNYLIIAVTILVVAIPEGLPLAVTLTLAYSMRAMYDDKILVRKLPSCQTMGAATYICSDKTGTLTQNKMNVVQVINEGSIPVSQFNSGKINPGYMNLLQNAIFHNSSALVDNQKGPQTQLALLKMARSITGRNQNDVRKRAEATGYFKRLPFDSTRKRMTTGVNVDGRDILFMNGASQQILKACDSIQSYQTNQKIPISPQTRSIITSQLQQMANRGLRTISVSYKPSNQLQVSRASAVSATSRQGQHQHHQVEQIEKNGFTLLGIFGIQDLPRPESKGSIENCRKAGIHVIMVTGDNKITATNIAKQVGIINDVDHNNKVMEAGQFMKTLQSKGLLKLEQQNKIAANPHKQGDPNQFLPTQQFKVSKKISLQTDQDRANLQQLLHGLVVLARSKPEHKYILVDGINQLGHVVGVTGDGANDAPALMRADVGLAMGVTGSQVAKNASDIILLDDNFESIVRAIVWGRNVYISIRRFLQFQLTGNVVACFVVIISSAVIRQSVFASVQMLWVNLIIDSFAALALATEPPNHQQLLKQKPNSPQERLLTRTMFKHIIGQAIFQVAILLLLLFLGPMFIPQSRDEFDSVIGADLQAKYYNGIAQGTVTDGKSYTIRGDDNYDRWFNKYHVYSRHITFVFNTFVFQQIFNFFCCRKINDELNLFKNIFTTKLFWFIVFVISASQILIITFGGRFFQVYNYYGLTKVQWLISIGIGFLTIPISIFLRLLPFAKPKLAV